MIAVDIGNTFIKTGVFAKGELQKLQRFTTAAETIAFITRQKEFFIAISSVNPEMLATIEQSLLNNGAIVQVAGLDSPFSFSIKYTTPQTLGIDRLCGLEGAIGLLKSRGVKDLYPLITIDSGTATTINCINKKAEFIGGTIMPGIGLMLQSLNRQTALLPGVEMSGNFSLIGNSTESCIQSGVLHSTIALIEKIKAEMLRAESRPVNVVCSGGSGELIANYLGVKGLYHPSLALLGLSCLNPDSNTTLTEVATKS
ncbi:MAG: type III pantothenate kinase [Ignavibacteriales bacterium]|nr:type III pantothenate kinase [Ignavibacteriales bacterium]